MIKTHNLQALLLKSKSTRCWGRLQDQPPKSEAVLPTQRFSENHVFLICLSLSINDVCTSSLSLQPGYLPLGCKYCPLTVGPGFCDTAEVVLTPWCCRYMRVLKRLCTQKIRVKTWGKKDSQAIRKQAGKCQIYNKYALWSLDPDPDFTNMTWMQHAL